MIWMIVCAVLAAAGLILIVWALLGWCVLPPRREAVTIYRPPARPLSRDQTNAHTCRSSCGSDAAGAAGVGVCLVA